MMALALMKYSKDSRFVPIISKVLCFESLMTFKWSPIHAPRYHVSKIIFSFSSSKNIHKGFNTLAALKLWDLKIKFISLHGFSLEWNFDNIFTGSFFPCYEINESAESELLSTSRLSCIFRWPILKKTTFCCQSVEILFVFSKNNIRCFSDSRVKSRHSAYFLN